MYLFKNVYIYLIGSFLSYILIKIFIYIQLSYDLISIPKSIYMLSSVPINFDVNYSMRENLSEQKTVKIYTDADFSKNELSKLKWVKGKNRVEIIINNQLLKLPGYFEVSSQMIDKMKNLKGVTKVDLI